MLKWVLAAAGISGLIAVRMLEDQIFYDPFLNYFHEASKLAVFPKFEWGKLIVSHLFRLGINLALSLLIIQALFQNRNWTAQAAVLIVLVFAVTFPLYLYSVSEKFQNGYLFSFYMRRFVIQPVILLLIVPLFYSRKKKLLY